MKVFLFIIFSLFILNFTTEQLIPIQNNGKWGYCNKEKNLIIDYTYSTASTFNKSGYAIVSTKEKYGIINVKNEWIIKPKYSMIQFTLNVNELIVKNKKGKVGIVNVKNEKILPIDFDSIKVFDHNHSYLTYKDNLCGLYNTKLHEWELPMEYTYVTFNNYGLLEVSNGTSIGIVNKENYSIITEPKIIQSKTRGGKLIKAIKFEKFEEFTVVKTNNGYNIINRKGEEQLSKSTSKAIKRIDRKFYNSNGFKLPYNAKYLEGNNVYIENKNRKIEIKQLEIFKIKKELNEGIEIKYLSESGKYALFKGGEKVSFEYDSIFLYNDDFVQAISYDNGEKQSALLPISASNTIKVTPVVEGFESILSYVPSSGSNAEDDWIIIIDDQKRQGLFDLKKGTYIIDMKYEQLFVPFVESYGLAIVGNNEDKFAFYDMKARKQVTDMKYEANINTQCLDEDVIFLERLGEMGETTRVLDVYNIKEHKLTGYTIDGFNIVKRKPKGTIHFSQNALGWETNIDYELSEFAPENYQYYFLQDKGVGMIGIGFMDANFNIVLPPNYATVAFTSKGNNYLKVTDFEFNEGIIDISGKVIIPFGKYMSVGVMEEGIAPVEDFNGKKFFVNNKDEKYIVNP